MKHVVKGLLFCIILVLSWYLGIALLAGFVWWKVMLFFLLAKVVGNAAYKLFRWIDKIFS